MKNLMILSVCMALFVTCKHEIPGLIGDASCIKEYMKEVPLNDTPANFNCDCVPFSCEEVLVGGNPYDIKALCFNPNNPDQLAFIRWDNTGEILPVPELWVADFCEGIKWKIADHVRDYIDWSVKGKLLFMDLQNRHFTANADGSNIKLLPTGYYYSTPPKWSLDGSKILFGSNAVEDIPLLFSEDTNEIDTLYGFSHFGVLFWENPHDVVFSELVSSDKNEIKRITDFDKDSEVVLREFTIMNNDSLIIAIQPALDGDIYVCFWHMVGRLDVETGQFILMKKTNDFWQWNENMVVTPDHKEVIIVKRKLVSVDNCHYDSEYTLEVINYDGSTRRVLTIPE